VRRAVRGLPCVLVPELLAVELGYRAHALRRRALVPIIAALPVVWVAPLANADVIYQYTGNPFTTVTGPYTTGDFVSITFTTPDTLVPNLQFQNVAASVIHSAFATVAGAVAASAGREERAVFGHVRPANFSKWHPSAEEWKPDALVCFEGIAKGRGSPSALALTRLIATSGN